MVTDECKDVVTKVFGEPVKDSAEIDWMTWLLIALAGVLVLSMRLLKPWLNEDHDPEDGDEFSSPPPECCAVTATLGQILQSHSDTSGTDRPVP